MQTSLLLVLLLEFVFAYFAFAKEDNVLLHFIQISDTHINFDDLPDKAKIRGNSERLLIKAIDQINEIRDLDFVLATGDLINKPKIELLERFLNIVANLRFPLYVILGNHDVGVGDELKKEDYIRKFYEMENPTSFHNGMSYYSFSPNDYFTVICLDTTHEDFISRLGRIDDKQLFWLQNELEMNRDKFVLIALHISPIDPFKSSQDLFFDPSRKEFLDLINKHDNVIALFSGDYHAAKIFEAYGKIYSIAPATVRYPCAFREIIIKKVNKKKWKFWDKKKEIVDVEFKWHVIDEPELVEYSKNLSIDPGISEGDKEDRENTIRVKVSGSITSRGI